MQDPRIPHQPHVARCPDTIDPLDWINGRIMPDPGPMGVKLSHKEERFRGGIIGGLLPLFHQYFIDELTRLGIDNIQYFPVELEDSEGNVEYTYSLANVIGLIEAVNVNASVIKPRASGGHGRLFSFKIDHHKARDHRLFRLAEAPTLIIIDEYLWKDILAFNPPGVMLLPTERYDGY